MTKAQSILAHGGTSEQRRKWVQGNSVRQEHDSTRGVSVFYYEDGSKIINQNGNLRAA